MHDEHTGTVVVIREKQKLKIPIGIIADRDIAIEVVAFGLDERTLTTGDLMTPHLATAREDTDLLAALAMMREHGVRRLPVVDSQGALAGIVSADDLLALPYFETSASLLGMVALPPSRLLSVVLVVIAYLTATELVMHRFYARRRPTRTKPRSKR